MIIIRKATKKDLQIIVNIHLERFSSFFLTSLGNSFLKVFYKGFLKKPGLVFVLEHDGVIKGFIAGSIINKSFFKKLVLNNFVEFCLQGIKILFSNPSAIKRILLNVGDSEKNTLVFSEILSIATLKNRDGYGKLLLQEFESEIYKACKPGFSISLTTDMLENDKAIKFYKDSGYSVLNKFESFNGRKMYRFIKNI